jgi:hypothetical protein
MYFKGKDFLANKLPSFLHSSQTGKFYYVWRAQIDLVFSARVPNVMTIGPVASHMSPRLVNELIFLFERKLL